MDGTFVLDDPTGVHAFDELAELARPTFEYHQLPDSFEWADDGALTY